MPSESTVALRRSALRGDPDGEVEGVVRRAVTVSDAVHLDVEVDGIGTLEALGDDIALHPGDRVRLALDPRGTPLVGSAYSLHPEVRS